MMPPNQVVYTLDAVFIPRSIGKKKNQSAVTKDSTVYCVQEGLFIRNNESENSVKNDLNMALFFLGMENPDFYHYCCGAIRQSILNQICFDADLGTNTNKQKDNQHDDKEQDNNPAPVKVASAFADNVEEEKVSEDASFPMQRQGEEEFDLVADGGGDEDCDTSPKINTKQDQEDRVEEDDDDDDSTYVYDAEESIQYSNDSSGNSKSEASDGKDTAGPSIYEGLLAEMVWNKDDDSDDAIADANNPFIYEGLVAKEVWNRELKASRAEYNKFPDQIFRNRFFKAKTAHKEKPYWQNERNKSLRNKRVIEENQLQSNQF